MSVSAAFESPQKNSIRNLLKAAHQRAAELLVWPGECVQIVDSRERIAPMARSFQKNEKARGNLNFVLVSNRHINVSKAQLQVVQSGRLESPVGERELLDDSDWCTRYGGLVKWRACSGIPTTKLVFANMITMILPAHTGQN